MNEADELQIIRRIVDREIEAFEHLVLKSRVSRAREFLKASLNHH